MNRCSSQIFQVASQKRPSPVGDLRKGPKLDEVGRHRLHVAEAGVAETRDRGLGTAREHDVGVTVADVTQRLAEGVGAGSARGDDAEVDGLGLELDGHDAGGDVGDERRDREGRDARRTALDEDAGLVLDGLHAADAGTDDHAKALGVDLGDIQLGVVDGHPGGGDGVLRVAVVALGLLRVHELARIEVTHLGPDLGREIRRVETRDAGDTGTALGQGVPEGLGIMAKRRQATDAGDDDATGRMGGAHGSGPGGPGKVTWWRWP